VILAAVAIALYFAVLVLLGKAAARGADGSAASYYLAGRGLGSVALFFALFGTNCSPFVLVGIPGLAYHDGFAVFSLNAPIIALGIPLTFFLVGGPAKRMSARFGAISPVELIGKRLDSRPLALLLFAAFTAFTLPYMVTGVAGCGLALEKQFDGALSARQGAFLSLLVAIAYTRLGGMRATALTNVFQGALFLMVVTLVAAAAFRSRGGPEQAFVDLAAATPEALVLDRTAPRYAPRAFFSWSLAITFTVVCFPHMLARLMAAGPGALKSGARVYPVALIVLWLAAVSIGTLGALDVPGLVGRESDRIFTSMVALHLPAGFAVAGTLAVLAAAMSTLDAQLLTLSSMISRDVLAKEGRSRRAEGIFLVAVGVAVFLLNEFATARGLSIFAIANHAFSGYVMLFPTIVLALRWRGFSAAGAIASILGGCLALWLYETGRLDPHGFLPVAPSLLISAVLGVVVSCVTKKPGAAVIDRAFLRDPPPRRG
jgi:SSS family solute:Na+ symporter